MSELAAGPSDKNLGYSGIAEIYHGNSVYTTGPVSNTSKGFIQA